MPTTKKKKKPVSVQQKRKGKIVVTDSIKVRPKGTETRNVRTVPVKSHIPDNGASFKIKIRKK